MPSRQATCPPPLTVLTVLWVTLVRCGVAGSPGPGCDNGKLFLDRDLPADAVYWDCPGSTWPESSQTHPSVDTVYDPVPAMQICMDKSISYNHTIPNSGAYRPVRAESGEYVYCPPQRWLNNLHHGAAVLLYHPCAALRERLLLSALARSCLPDHIVTSHPRLSEHTPIAFVSWGHTLELPTAASPDVYGWLETRRKEVVGGSRSRKYNLLLTRSAEQHGQQHAPLEEQTEESLRRCFERTISSQLNGALESNMKRHLKPMKERGQRRRMRAAIKEIPENEKEDTITNRTTISRTGDVQNNNSTLGASTDSPPGSRTPSDPPGSEIQNTDQGLTSRPTTPLGTNMSRTTLTGDSQQPSPKHTDTINPLSEGVNREHSKTARPGDEDEGTASVKQRDEGFVKHSLKENASKANIFDEDNTAGGSRRDNEVVDVKERELEHKTTHSDTHSHQKSDRNAVDPVSKGQSEPQPHQNPQTDSLPNSPDCDGCNEDSDAVNTGLPRTPRTDEAVWAAAALGFLLILLTLSVLHTRLYRHWRTTPSLYWRDPQQDYDSVADVIRRRLRIANKRGKRGRRRECVLLPSSSSSDEHP